MGAAERKTLLVGQLQVQPVEKRRRHHVRVGVFTGPVTHWNLEHTVLGLPKKRS